MVLLFFLEPGWQNEQEVQRVGGGSHYRRSPLTSPVSRWWFMCVASCGQRGPVLGTHGWAAVAQSFNTEQ